MGALAKVKSACAPSQLTVLCKDIDVPQPEEVLSDCLDEEQEWHKEVWIEHHSGLWEPPEDAGSDDDVCEPDWSQLYDDEGSEEGDGSSQYPDSFATTDLGWITQLGIWVKRSKSVQHLTIDCKYENEMGSYEKIDRFMDHTEEFSAVISNCAPQLTRLDFFSNMSSCHTRADADESEDLAALTGLMRTLTSSTPTAKRLRDHSESNPSVQHQPTGGHGNDEVVHTARISKLQHLELKMADISVLACRELDWRPLIVLSRLVLHTSAMLSESLSNAVVENASTGNVDDDFTWFWARNGDKLGALPQLRSLRLYTRTVALMELAQRIAPLLAHLSTLQVWVHDECADADTFDAHCAQLRAALPASVSLKLLNVAGQQQVPHSDCIESQA